MENIIKETDYIPIQINIIEDKNCFVAFPKDINFPEFDGCIVQSDTREGAKKRILISLKAMIRYYEISCRKYRQKAIFRGNCTKNQAWFTIIGIGMVFYWRNKEFKNKFPKIKPSYQFHIGRLWFSFRNEWKNKKHSK